MLRSMTGYGHESRTFGPLTFTVEMKSVNHRYLEVVVRLPREWGHLEERLRRTVQSRLKRGRVEVVVSAQRGGEFPRTASVDWQLAECYYDAARQAAQRFGFPEESQLRVNELLSIPGVFSLREEDVPEEAADELISCAETALGQLVGMRETEGRFLAEDAMNKRRSIGSFIDGMRRLAPLAVAEYRTKLAERIALLLEGDVPLNQDRLAAEVAYFAERSGIDEELTRLESHTVQFELLLQADEPIGRKLDFLLQEMNREANTIGSKANHAELSAMVVDVKAELEKLREQVQNIE